jgi:choline dehydrogenase
MTGKRSHSGVGHYQGVIERRKNYDLLIKHKVTRVIYGEDPNAGPPKVEIQNLADMSVKVATANLEVVISAGSIHTPQILQRSGIADAAFLQKAGIKLVANLPGVGYNFQDHGGGGISATSQCYCHH